MLVVLAILLLVMFVIVMEDASEGGGTEALIVMVTIDDAFCGTSNAFASETPKQAMLWKESGMLRNHGLQVLLSRRLFGIWNIYLDKSVFLPEQCSPKKIQPPNVLPSTGKQHEERTPGSSRRKLSRSYTKFRTT
jgi:hypothetical protein